MADLVAEDTSLDCVALAPGSISLRLYPHELSILAQCVPLDESFNMARSCHVARMSRLEELFQQLSTVLPKGKGGNRRQYNDDAIVEKAHAFWKSSGTGSKVEAAREAMARFPGLYEGSGKTLSIAKRIAKKM